MDKLGTIIWLSRKHCEKGEIARYEHFFLFPQCFQKPSVVDAYLWSKALLRTPISHDPDHVRETAG